MKCVVLLHRKYGYEKAEYDKEQQIEEDRKTCRRLRRVDFLMVLTVTPDLSELSICKTGITPDCQHPGGGNKSLSSGKLSGHWYWFSTVGAILLQITA